jgi:hypothetical protein
VCPAAAGPGPAAVSQITNSSYGFTVCFR